MGLDQATQLEFAIGTHHRVGIDGEIDGKLADSGQLISGSERAGSDAAADLVDELAVDRHATVQVNREPWRRGSVVPSHACQCTTLLVHYVKNFLVESRMSAKAKGPAGCRALYVAESITLSGSLPDDVIDDAMRLIDVMNGAIAESADGRIIFFAGDIVVRLVEQFEGAV